MQIWSKLVTYSIKSFYPTRLWIEHTLFSCNCRNKCYQSWLEILWLTGWTTRGSWRGAEAWQENSTLLIVYRLLVLIRTSTAGGEDCYAHRNYYLHNYPHYIISKAGTFFLLYQLFYMSAILHYMTINAVVRLQVIHEFCAILQETLYWAYHSFCWCVLLSQIFFS